MTWNVVYYNHDINQEMFRDRNIGPLNAPGNGLLLTTDSDNYRN